MGKLVKLNKGVKFFLGLLCKCKVLFKWIRFNNFIFFRWIDVCLYLCVKIGIMVVIRLML